MSETNFFDFNFTPISSKYNREFNYSKDDIVISIITPYYNSSKTIFDTAKSVINQTLPCFEWIIINDGSTKKDTSEILERLANMDERIKIYTKNNEGFDSARVYGYNKAKANIVFYLDSSDLIDKTMLECGFFSMLTNPTALLCYSNVISSSNKIINLSGVFLRKDIYSKLGLKNVLDINKIKEINLDESSNCIKMQFYGIWHKNTNGTLEKLNLIKEGNDFNQSIDFQKENNNEFLTYPYMFKEKINIKNKSKKNNILFIIPWAAIGGADSFNLNYIKYLKKNGFEITIITTETHNYELRQNFEKNVDEFFDLTTFLKKRDWPAFIYHIIRTRDINLIFQCNSMYGYMIIPWLKYNFPKVSIVDFLHAEQWEWRNGGYPRDSIAISNFLDKTYVCNNHLKNVMVDQMNKRNNNTEVIYVGVDVEKFSPDNTDISDLDNKLLEKIKNKKVILFPCRLAYIKRPILVLNILKELLLQQKDVILLVVGDGPAREDMLEYINKYNLSEYVEFVGYKEDVRPYYKIADVTLITSLSEGITLTTYESLSMGTPVITSDVGGQKELVDNTVGRVEKNYQSKSEDEFNFVYTHKEIYQYVEDITKIFSLTSNEKFKMKLNCRKKMVDKYSSEKMYDKLMNDNEQLIEQNKTKNIKKNNIELYERYLVNFNEKEHIKNELKNVYEQLECKNKELCDVVEKNNLLEDVNHNMNSKIECMTLDINEKSEEIMSIKSSRSYKIYNKFKKIIKK